MIRILPWTGRSHRADLDVVWNVSHSIRLAWKVLDFRLRPRALHFPLAQQFNLVDGDRSFSRQHLDLFHSGPLRLGSCLHQRDHDRHRDRRQNRLQRDDLRQQRRVAAHLAGQHIGRGSARHRGAGGHDDEARAGNAEAKREREKNWVFSTEEEIFGLPTAEEMLDLPEFGPNGELKAPKTRLERPNFSLENY